MGSLSYVVWEERCLFGKIIVLTFDDSEETMVKVALTELQRVARITDQITVSEPTINSYGGLIANGEERIVYENNNAVNLTFKEFEILHLLAQNPGRVFSKEQIYDIVWKEPCVGDCSIVMNHIQKIRKKLGDDSRNPVYIQTVWGVGYRFNKEIGSSL